MLRSLDKTRIAIIGGSGLEKLFENPRKSLTKTPFGTALAVSVGEIGGKQVAFLPRHGPCHSVAPHRINYRANIYALHKLGVIRILATNAVGAINRDFIPGELVVPHDFIDFTKTRSATFYDRAPVTHIDVSEPYCPEMRQHLTNAAKKVGLRVRDKGVMVCTEGPRLETPAEIEMFRHLGCDVVGMTGYPEVVLARELEICYASACYVSNMAAGIRERLKAHELSTISEQTLPILQKLFIEVVKGLPIGRSETCPCASALQSSRFK
jgi:5'-methylthioadenosine phosphorylase